MTTSPTTDRRPELRPGERPGANLPAPVVPPRRVHSLDSGRARVRASRPTCPDAQCGQAALAYVTGLRRAAVCEAVGHGGPMTFREMRRFLERHAGIVPTIATGDALRRSYSRLWWQYGGDRFLALVGDLQDAPDFRMLSAAEIEAGTFPAPLGHVVVLDGRTLVDWSAGETRRFRPRDLARYDLALILSSARSA